MSTTQNAAPGPSWWRDAHASVDQRFTALLERLHVDRRGGRMVVLLAVAFAFFAVANPKVFLDPLNLQNIALVAPEVGLLALAMMLAMLTGGIDLSVVSIANLSAIAISTSYAAETANGGEAAADRLTPVLVVLGVLVGVTCGLANGVLVAVVGITPILATLGTLQVFNGLAIVWTGGRTLESVPPSLRALGQVAVAGVPLLFLVLVGVAVVLAVVVNCTPLGKRIQFEGANPTAAAYSGINSRTVLLTTYTVTGAIGGLTGVLFLARNATASADYGASYVLLVIVVAVLGGTNSTGGFATVLGVVLAALTLQVVSTGFITLRLSAYQYGIAQGVILIVVMVLDRIAPRRRRPRRTPQPEPVTS